MRIPAAFVLLTRIVHQKKNAHQMDLVSADVAQIQQPANVRNLATFVLRLGYSRKTVEMF